MSLQGDILRIQNIVGRRYKAEGKACIAGISDGVKASSCFTGDAEVMLDILADMAGNTIGQMSEDPEELTRISMAFRRAVTRFFAARGWSRVTAKPKEVRQISRNSQARIQGMPLLTLSIRSVSAGML